MGSLKYYSEYNPDLDTIGDARNYVKQGCEIS